MIKTPISADTLKLVQARRSIEAEKAAEKERKAAKRKEANREKIDKSTRFSAKEAESDAGAGRQRTTDAVELVYSRVRTEDLWR